MYHRQPVEESDRNIPIIVGLVCRHVIRSVVPNVHRLAIIDIFPVGRGSCNKTTALILILLEKITSRMFS
jgi:hypothetical protein